MKNALLLLSAMLFLVPLPRPLNANETDAGPSGVKVRVLSPRSGAELTHGTDRVTIVVEVEDSTEQGISLKKGVPVFETPLKRDGTTNQLVKDNLDVFLKNLVGVTTYTLPRRPGRPLTTVYQLTAVIRTVLLNGGCQLPVYPPDLELPKSGEVIYHPSGYVQGAALQFIVAGSRDEASEGENSTERVCIILPSAQPSGTSTP